MALFKKPINPLALVLALSGVFFVIFLIISGTLFLTSSPSKTSSQGMGGNLFGSGSIGILEVSGPIMDSKKTLARLEKFEEDDAVKAIVVRLNSPGGAVAPSQEIYQAIKKFKKPVVASMGSVAASGAFYIAMGAKKVYANPGTITGSIGVIAEFVNLEKLYEWAKVKRYSLKTGKFKDAGAEYREMTADERALLQGMIDDVLLQFKKAVAEGRKLTLDQVTAIADGRVFSGSQAKAAKLVDELGTLQDAIDEAGKMAKIKGKPETVYPEKKKKRLWESLLEEQREDYASSRVERLLQKIAAQLLGPSVVTAESEDPGFSPGVYWLWNGPR